MLAPPAPPAPPQPDVHASLAVFDEPIDFSLDAGVPDPVPFETKLRDLLETHEQVLEPSQHAIGHSIMMVVGQFSMIEGSANRLDTEQEREQEQEQEKEVEARKDQQIEVEKFVDREFSRQEETQRPCKSSYGLVTNCIVHCSQLYFCCLCATYLHIQGHTVCCPSRCRYGRAPQNSQILL